MKIVKKDDEKTKRMLTARSVAVAFFMLMINVLSLVISPLLGVGTFNTVYFTIMFVSMILGYCITLFSKANPDMPVPVKPTKQVGNILKAIADVIVSNNEQNIPAVQRFKEKLKELVMWELREAQATEEMPQEILEDARKYIMNKILETNDKVRE